MSLLRERTTIDTMPVVVVDDDSSAGQQSVPASVSSPRSRMSLSMGFSAKTQGRE